MFHVEHENDLPTDFSIIIEEVLENEAGIVYHPDDPGGLSNLGITLRAYKNIFPQCSNPTEALKSLNEKDAVYIYYEHYWKPLNISKIDNIYIKYKIFDHSIEMYRDAISLAQKSYNKIIGLDILKCDGKIENKTIKALENVKTKKFIATYIYLLKEYFGYSHKRSDLKCLSDDKKLKRIEKVIIFKKKTSL